MTEQWFATAVSLQQSGRTGEAKLLYEKVLAQNAAHGPSLHNLALIALGSGQPEIALSHFRAAWTSEPRHQQFWSSLVDALVTCGRFTEASELTSQASGHGIPANVIEAARGRISKTQQEPRPSQQQIQRLVALFNAQKFEEMEGWSRAFGNAAPDCGFYWKAHGTALRMMNRPSEALASLKRASELSPEDSELKNILGATSRDLGLNAEAEAAYRAAVHFNPRSFDAHYNLSALLQFRGAWALSEPHARTAVELEPKTPKARVLLGIALTNLLRHDEARTEIEIAAANIEASIPSAEGVETTPVNSTDSAASPPEAFVQFTDPAYFYSSLLFQGSYLGLWTNTDYLARARKWEALLPARPGPVRNASSFVRAPRTGRKLRIGYVSMDFRKHSVAQFIVGLLQQHDRTRVEIFLYSTHSPLHNDAITAEIRSYCDQWRECRSLTIGGVLSLIDEDKIDVLVDLAGHSDGNGLRAFARRAAPIQCHYLGYFASTGLKEMDYWIGDDFVFGAAPELQFSEKLWRLPGPWMAFTAPTDAPEIEWSPAPGQVRFATFNGTAKITKQTLDVWSDLLHALPASRLVLKAAGYEEQQNRALILAAFQQRGVDPARFDLIGKESSWQRHMSLYSSVDIALDPIGGLSGGTTTCEALWMGVPVITLAGECFAQRMSADFVNAVGGGRWVARSASDYIAKAVDLAAHIPDQAARVAQRATMARSSLCDVKGLAHSLENAYEEMFDAWHASQRSA